MVQLCYLQQVAQQSVAVTDNNNGTYTATVTNTVAESVTISGTLDGAAITDTAAITFTVGAARSDQCKHNARCITNKCRG